MYYAGWFVQLIAILTIGQCSSESLHPKPSER
jgi:hypothetical protein